MQSSKNQSQLERLTRTIDRDNRLKELQAIQVNSQFPNVEEEKAKNASVEVKNVRCRLQKVGQSFIFEGTANISGAEKLLIGSSDDSWKMSEAQEVYIELFKYLANHTPLELVNYTAGKYGKNRDVMKGYREILNAAIFKSGIKAFKGDHILGIKGLMKKVPFLFVSLYSKVVNPMPVFQGKKVQKYFNGMESIMPIEYLQNLDEISLKYCLGRLYISTLTSFNLYQGEGFKDRGQRFWIKGYHRLFELRFRDQIQSRKILDKLDFMDRTLSESGIQNLMNLIEQDLA